MKAVILVAGAGIRLRPHTHTQPKPLVPIAGKPILGHIIERFLAAGIKEFIFVIGYLGEKIEDYVLKFYGEKCKAHFVVQQPREGSAHAVWCAREHLKEDETALIMLGDTIVDVNIDAMVNSPYSVVGIKKVENPCDFGIAEVGKYSDVKRLVEKPLIPKSNLALVGIYKVVNIPLLIDCIEYLLINHIKTNEEYHLTDALMLMLDKEERFASIEVEKWYDCGKKESLLQANALLMAANEFKISPIEDYPSNIFIQPVKIGRNCTIKNSVIGPNVAVGDNAQIHTSIVQNSIIGSFSELENALLTNSIIGNESVLRGFKQSLNIGDGTEINYNEYRF